MPSMAPIQEPLRLKSPQLNDKHNKLPPSPPAEKPALVHKIDTKPRSASVDPETPTPKPSAPVQPAVDNKPDIVEEQAQPDVGGTIDMETFQQILELDEDDERDFSRGMTCEYFDQANTTFKDMDDAFKREDLEKLSSLGHFLKGSSAALGVTKVQASCEKIQHYGSLRDEEAGVPLAPEAALKKIDPLLKSVKIEYAVAEKWLKEWYLTDSQEPGGLLALT